MLAREQPKSMRILLIKKRYKLYIKRKKTREHLLFLITILVKNKANQSFYSTDNSLNRSRGSSSKRGPYRTSQVLLSTSRAAPRDP